MKRALVLLTSTAVMVLGFASAALAQASAAQYQYGGDLPTTGGPVSLLPLFVVLGVVLLLGGLAMIINLTRNDFS